jgi:hypothetical protein
MTKPEVLHPSRVGRADRGIRFDGKESALVERAKRGGTGGIATLVHHNAPLTLFALKRLPRDCSCVSLGLTAIVFR